MDNKYEWSLSELYEGIDSSQYKNDFEAIENLIEEINNFAINSFKDNANAQEKLEEYLSIKTKLEEKFKLGNYVYLLFSTNSGSTKLKKEIDKLDKIFSDTVLSSVLFRKFLTGLNNIEDIINSSEKLKELEHHILEEKKLGKLNLTDEEEVILSKMQITGSKGWAKLRSDLISSLLIEVEVDGKIEKLPFPAVRNMAFDKDEKIRKNAYEAEMKAYKNIDVSISHALNNLKSEVLTISALKGVTPLENTLINSRMDKEILDAMFSAIDESLPKLQKYFSLKAKELNGTDKLEFYDVYAPVGEFNKKYTYEEATNYIEEILSGFDKQFGNYIRKAVDNRWIDVYPKENKRDGAFCSNIPQIKESRIMLNFSGSFSCLSTTAHELGHGYHGQCLSNEQLLNTNYPMPIAETASIFFETLVVNEALAKLEGEEKKFILHELLTSEVSLVIDLYSRFLFEDRFFDKRKEGPLSVEEICTIMEQSQRETYGENLNTLHEYIWLVKPHYYMPERNYYNFPYIFGLLFSKGIYAKSKEMNDNELFTNKYNELLSKTGKMDIHELGLSFGIDLKDKAFWKSSLETIENLIDTL